MRVLITGVAGFAGRWLARELATNTRDTLYGILRKRSSAGATGRSPLQLPKRIRIIQCDLGNAAQTRRVIRKIRPDRIYHLAGQSSVSQSWKKPAQTRRDNVAGSRNLLRALVTLGLSPQIHVAGSAEVYGSQRARRIRETARPNPRNPYARSKFAQERLFLSFGKKTGAKVVVTRSFNTAGPGQRPAFVLSDFARQIARIELKKTRPVLRAGNTSAVRDFTDVRDAVRAYRAAIETGRSGSVYNVATGRGRSIGALLARMKRLSKARVRLERDPARLRAADIPALVGEPSKIRRETGWRPRIPIQRTLKDMLTHWRRTTDNI